MGREPNIDEFNAIIRAYFTAIIPDNIASQKELNHQDVVNILKKYPQYWVYLTDEERSD